MTAERKDALGQLKPRSKAAKLRALMPLIRAKLEEGVQHADIIRLLNEQGLELTERTYQSYLYRHRKKQQAVGKRRGNAPPFVADPAAVSTTAQLVQPDATSKGRSVGQRPRTFNYDPKGNPELLK